MLANIKYKLAAATGSKRTTAAQKDQKFYGPTKDDIVFVAEYDRMVAHLEPPKGLIGIENVRRWEKSADQIVKELLEALTTPNMSLFRCAYIKLIITEIGNNSHYGVHGTQGAELIAEIRGHGVSTEDEAAVKLVEDRLLAIRAKGKRAEGEDGSRATLTERKRANDENVKQAVEISSEHAI